MTTATPTETRARRTGKTKEQNVAPAVEPTVTPVEIEKDVKLCECNCGEVVSPKSRFRPGHDARLRGILQRRFDAGDEAAAVELMNRGWATNDQLEARHERVEAKAKARLQREADRKAREEAKAAKKQTQSSRTAKAGRELARKQQEQVSATA